MIGIIILPYLGVLLYLIVRGHKMAEHAQQAAQAQDAAAKAYIQSAAGTSEPVRPTRSSVSQLMVLHP